MQLNIGAMLRAHNGWAMIYLHCSIAENEVVAILNHCPQKILLD